jgi:hypothetical protein
MYLPLITVGGTNGLLGVWNSQFGEHYNGTLHSQNAGLGRHFPMDAHEGGVEPRKPGIVFLPWLNDRDNISRHW